MKLQSLPKVELHLHLDCSLSYQAVSRLAPSVTPEEYQREYVAPSRCTNLAHFLTRAPKGYMLMQTEEALRLVTADVYKQLIADGVVYAELRFAPFLHTHNGLTPERVVEVVDRASDDLTRETGLEVRLILCTLRYFSQEQSMHTAKLVDKFRGSRVAALDLAGDEAGFPLTNHIDAYRFAREQGLLRTAHAGEGAGPESVWETLRRLQPMRIGHGTRSIEDPQLVEHLRDNQIHLEMCPSANVQLMPSVPEWEDHPIDRLFRAKVPLSVSTDTRMLNPTTLIAEYEGLRRTFGWKLEDFMKANLMGLDAAFVEKPVKHRLRQAMLSEYARTEWQTA